MSEEMLVLDDCAAPVRVLTLNRPAARNALSLALMEALTGAVEAVGPETRAVILRAEGPVFCAGHDLREMTGARNDADAGCDAYRETFAICVRLMEAIRACPAPVIAEVHGMATAAGCQLVATCDLAVAAEEARFATPGVNIGLFCSTPMVPLSRNVPAKVAMEMLLTGEPLSAQDAKSFGLVNRVVPAGRLSEETRALAEQIASKAGRVIRDGKKNFYRQMELPIEDAYAAMAEVMATDMMAEEAKEGVGAFVEKRKPEWPGN